MSVQLHPRYRPTVHRFIWLKKNLKYMQCVLDKIIRFCSVIMSLYTLHYDVLKIIIIIIVQSL